MQNKPNSQRRFVLKAAAATMAMPRIISAQTPTNPDVIIIGAGIAGSKQPKHYIKKESVLSL